MKRLILVFTGFIGIHIAATAQNVLPNFTLAKGFKNSNIISWRNNYGDACVQLNVQRSVDSLKNFRTVFTVPAPQLPANAYSDRLSDTTHYFYRIFYMLQNGSYFFTPSRSVAEVKKPEPMANEPESNDKTEEKNIITKLPNAPEPVPTYLNTNKSGAVTIKLPEQDLYRYSMVIYAPGTNTDTLFWVKHFDEPFLVLDKAAFVRGGWYGYKIFKDGTELEKNKFFIAK